MEPLLHDPFVPWRARLDSFQHRVFVKDKVKRLPKNSFVDAPCVKVSIINGRKSRKFNDDSCQLFLCEKYGELSDFI